MCGPMFIASVYSPALSLVMLSKKNCSHRHTNELALFKSGNTTPSYFSAYVPSLRLQYTTPHFNCICTISFDIFFFIKSIADYLILLKICSKNVTDHTVYNKVVDAVLYVALQTVIYCILR